MHTKPHEIIRSKVKSSNIASIGYDQPTRTMTIEFTTGQIYSYHPVMEQAYNDLLKAESIGKHFFAHFKNNDKLAYVQLP